MRRSLSTLFLACALLLAVPRTSQAVEVGVSLRGSPSSMIRQNHVAKELGYEFVETAEALDSLLEAGVIVPLEGNRHYYVKKTVSHPYARPEVRLFIERLAEQYHEGTGEVLVVTSLMRPTSDQPRNSHNLSVHPTGIAIDLRVSSRRHSRAWLESVLLKLEGKRLLDITRERWPPHYHVALFPDEYITYLEDMIGAEEVAASLDFHQEEEEKQAPSMINVSSLPPVTVVASATTGGGSSLWMFILGAAPVTLLIFSLLSFREELVDRRPKG